MYDNDDKQLEIDILCVANGEFLAVEVKKTVCGFLKEDEINKFIKKIELIKPDVAILAFENYGENDNEVDEIKAKFDVVKKKIRKCFVDYALKFEIIIACECDPDFCEYPVQFYPIGSRTRKFLSKCEEE